VEVRSRLPRLLACGLLAFSLAGWSADEPHAVPDLTVHEWGTFTAIPGVYGSARILVTNPGDRRNDHRMRKSNVPMNNCNCYFPSVIRLTSHQIELKRMLISGGASFPPSTR
jgi:hypothetical protein